MTQKRLPLTLHLWQVWLNKRSSAFDPGHAAVIGRSFLMTLNFKQNLVSLHKQINPTRNARPIAPRLRKIQKISDKRQKCLKN